MVWWLYFVKKDIQFYQELTSSRGWGSSSYCLATLTVSCVWGERGDQVLTRKRRQSRMNCKERCDVHREMSLEHIREISLQRLLTSYFISIDKVTWIQCVCEVLVLVLSVNNTSKKSLQSDFSLYKANFRVWLKSVVGTKIKRWAQLGTRLRGRSSCHFICHYLASWNMFFFLVQMCYLDRQVTSNIIPFVI